MIKTWVSGLVLFVTVSLAGAGEAAKNSESEDKRIWKDKAEFSLVVTSGNAVSRTFGLANTLTGEWDRDSIELKIKAVRAQGVTLTRTAAGTFDNPAISENPELRLAAENYAASGSYSRSLTNGLLFKSGGGWERNLFAGISSRTVLAAGLGYALIETDTTRLRSDLSLTYTFRSYVESGPDRFAGIRIAGAIEKTVSPTTVYAGILTLDENLQNFTDWRIDTTHSLSVSVSRRLALKVGLDMVYIHKPAAQEIPLFGPDTEHTGDFVFAPLKKLDTVFTTSFVVDF